jgi:hypothetical protein
MYHLHAHFVHSLDHFDELFKISQAQVSPHVVALPLTQQLEGAIYNPQFALAGPSPFVDPVLARLDLQQAVEFLDFDARSHQVPCKLLVH